jgi:hypothetical protein
MFRALGAVLFLLRFTFEENLSAKVNPSHSPRRGSS